MKNKVSPPEFYSKIQKLHAIWTQKYSADFDTLIILNGKNDKNLRKTIPVITWLFSPFNLNDIIIILSKEQVFIIGSQKKINFLDNLKNQETKISLKFYLKQNNISSVFQSIWLKICKKNEIPKVGYFRKEFQINGIGQQLKCFLKDKTYDVNDISKFIYDCFSEKFERQCENIKISSLVATYFFKRFIKEVEKIIDQQQIATHSQITQKIESIMMNQNEMKKCVIKIEGSSNFKLNKDFIDLQLININSGGECSPVIYDDSDARKLSIDCIVLRLGILYQGYHSLVIRTLLINPSEEQKFFYKKLIGFMKHLQQHLKVGLTFKSIYEKGVLFMKENLKNIQVPKSFGSGIDIFLKNPIFQISQNNKRKIEVGQTLCLILSLLDLSQKGKKYSLQLSEVVLIKENGIQILTEQIGCEITDISYQFAENPQSKKQYEINERIGIKTRNSQKKQNTIEKLKEQKKRFSHQLELKKKNQAQLRQRLLSSDFLQIEKRIKNLEAQKIRCYGDKDKLPRDVKQNKIYVDQKNKAVLIPISGKHVPISIYFLKSVVKSMEGKYSSFRFNMHLPNTNQNIRYVKSKQNIIYFKEIVYRSLDHHGCLELEKAIKNLLKKSKQDLIDKIEKEDLTELETLKLNKDKRPILRDLYMRPNLISKKTKGNLECHLNGFRYSIKNDIIDIPFSNVKYAFFQPCQKQIIAAIHFRLNQGIIIGKKKCIDVQFYSEGGTNIQEVRDVKNFNRQEDSDDEQKQKQNRKKIDRQFMRWIKSCEDYKKREFQFEVPKRQKGFLGNHSRQNSFIQPTKSSLMNITELPFFICPFQEIQVVCFERIFANSKNFDIVMVKKDYQVNVKINAIPIAQIEKIKNLFDEKNLIFYDIKKPLNWTKFLQIIRKDFLKFVEDGGWLAWDEVDEQQEQNSEDESFSSFSQTSQSEDSSSSEYDEQNSNSSEEQLSDSGLSSQELEELAELEDRQNEKMRKEKDRKQMNARKVVKKK